MNKKARTNIWMIIIIIYIGLGIYYHIQSNPSDNLLSDMFTGGFKMLGSWFNINPPTIEFNNATGI